MCADCQITLVEALEEIHVRLVNINSKRGFPHRTTAYKIIVALPTRFHLTHPDGTEPPLKNNKKARVNTKNESKNGTEFGPGLRS